MLPRNDAELKAMLMKPLETATWYVVTKIMEQVEDANQETVYDVYDPIMYERTYELKNRWMGDVVASNDTAVGVVETMPTHATSAISGDVIENLYEIVYEGLAGHIFGQGAWTKKRNAWKTIEKKCGKANIKKWYGEGMRMTGLNIRNGRGGVTKS